MPSASSPLPAARSTAASTSCRFAESLFVDGDAALAGETPPALDFLLDEAAELLGRHRHRIDRFVRQALLERRRSERFADLAVQLGDDFRRHLRRADDAVPLHGVEPLEARLLEGGHIGYERMALEARH